MPHRDVYPKRKGARTLTHWAARARARARANRKNFNFAGALIFPSVIGGRGEVAAQSSDISRARVLPSPMQLRAQLAASVAR